ncbi:MAG: flagellar biosynthesis anti-sigma factor FlgM [Leptospiraceae bacterium]|nr:flagellar biosynthesis anti-sigma factor FlgM [Leptospiraceae bacterium]
MMIDKIKSIAQGLETRKTSLSKQALPAVNDNVQISEAAKLKFSESKLQAMITSTTNLVLSMPEDGERVQKVLDIKNKIQSGTYDFQSASVLDSTAENFLSISLAKTE